MAYENTDGGAAGAGSCEPGVSDSLRTFGAVVQALREHAGLSREEFAELVRFSKHTVASVEQGRRMPDRDFVERAEVATGGTGALRAAAPHLTRQAVLERGTGGEEVMRELFDHLLGLVERNWNVELQVMPLRQPVHAGMDGSMQLAETPDNRWFAYSEGQQNGRLISSPKEISLLQQRYAKLRSQAMTPEDSVGLLKRLRGAL
ncbi:Scr1 family TA system antitoxin-like transcriptional regulator [Streptomyces sp. NPDC004749]